MSDRSECSLATRTGTTKVFPSSTEPYNLKSVNQIVSVSQTTAQVCCSFHFTTSLQLYASDTGSKVNTFFCRKKTEKGRKEDSRHRLVRILTSSRNQAKCIWITMIIRRFTSLGLHCSAALCSAHESQSQL